MTDREIINALIMRDEQKTRQFFFKNCRPLFMSIIRQIFSYEVDYDEFVNELYLYLMENDAYRLRQFKGRSSLYQWLKVIAIRYFISKRDSMIDAQSANTPYKEQASTTEADDSVCASADLRHLLAAMPNQRYAYIIKRLLIDDIEPEQLAREIGIETSNLYNIKRRAMTQLTRVALTDIKRYDKR